MTQIVDKRLSKMCSKCQSMFDKPCAWLSLGNEYCDEIMEIQQEIERLEENNQNMQLEMAKSWQKIDKALRIIDKFKEKYIICFDKELWGFVKRLEKCLKGDKE